MAVYKILFGTYTKRVSKGIYEAELDTEKKLLQMKLLLLTYQTMAS